MIAVIGNGAKERHVANREEAISWAFSVGAETVDLWTEPGRPEVVMPGALVDDRAEPIAFDIPVKKSHTQEAT